MQLMPKTASWCALKTGRDYGAELLKEPSYNITLGAYYLKYLLDKFGSEKVALAAYNAGEGNVRRWQEEKLKKIPFPETEEYIKKVQFTKKVYKLKMN